MPQIPDFLRCPRSGEPLVARTDNLVASASGAHEYPIIHDIIDFRLFDAPYMQREHELVIASQLADASQRMNYEQLVRFFETDLLGTRTAERVASGIEHRLALRNRAVERLHLLIKKAGAPQVESGAWVLDLGCGSGEVVGGLLGLGAGNVIGIDISLTELLLGRKLLEEQGVRSFQVAGCAEALPFADNLFNMVYSPDVIEHVADQARYLSEARRVLKPSGELLLNSPNRFSLVAPEPHVGIWGLTCLPRAWVSPASQLLGKGPYVGKRLLSLMELRRMLNATFADVTVYRRRANPDAASILGRVFAALAPASEHLYAYICAEHVVRARNGPTNQA